jgi:hypothetical protein
MNFSSSGLRVGFFRTGARIRGYAGLRHPREISFTWWIARSVCAYTWAANIDRSYLLWRNMQFVAVGTRACLAVAASLAASCATDEPPLRCGAGTTLDGRECVAPPRLGITGGIAGACGAGTHQSGDYCVPEGISVASTEPCSADKRVMYLDGRDFVYTGMLTVTVADWLDLSDRKNVFLDVQIGDLTRGMIWLLRFETRFLSHDMVPGVYDMAERAIVGSPGHPGIDIAGEGRACSAPTGRFQVHDIEHRPEGNLARLLLSFEQRCSSNEPPLVGCVRYEP